MNYYTENIADFGIREIAMAADLMKAVAEGNCPIHRGGLRPAMNTNSGYVFLVNEDYEVAMMNGDKIEQFFTSPETGQEGFLEDFEGEDFIHLITELGLDDINGEVCELIEIYDNEPSRDIEQRIREQIIFHLKYQK